MQILYVEDGPADAELVARYVRMTPHHLTLAKTLHEAQEAVQEPHDLILIDVLIEHERKGYELVRDLRSKGDERPVIAVTALALPHDVDQCYKAGFTDVLLKPYDMRQLGDMLRKYEPR